MNQDISGNSWSRGLGAKTYNFPSLVADEPVEFEK